MGLFDNFKQQKSSAKKTDASPEPLFSSFFNEKRIVFFNAGPSKQQVFGSLISSLDLPDPSAGMKALLAREEAGSTIITEGVAFPHARINGISKIEAALGIYPAGLEDATGHTKPIQLFLLFLGPADNMRQHLSFLATAAALFQNPKAIATLTKQTTPQAVLKKLKELERKI